MDNREFGSLLKAARLSQGLSQTALWTVTGISKAMLSRYEHGHVLPSLPTLRKIQAVYEIGDAVRSYLTENTSA